MIHASWGGVGIASYMPRKGCAADPQFGEALKQWDKDWADFRASNDPAKNPNRHDNFNNAIQQPAGLYNGSVAPIQPYGLRGVVWYQGETDAGNPAPYAKRLIRMIRLWRKAWDNKDMPFLIVQLPGFYAPTEGPADGGWAQAREAQKLAAKATNSQLVVTIDLGDAENIHPLNKKDVGKRLALSAAANVYGCQNVAFSGPVFQSARRKGTSVVVTFTRAKGLCTSDGGPAKGFVVAGADGVYQKADARIEGNRVIVASPKVRQPVKIRYAWADNPVCNLSNKAKLPAQPFQAEIGNR
jgi:sialate O-acetylesterase